MPRETTTSVAIIGAGPAGLMLANLLQRRGTPCQVVERLSRERVLARARAGMLEHRTVELLDRIGLGERMHAEGAVHNGCEFRYGETSFFADYSAMYDNTPHVIYPQQEVVADLLAGFEAGGGRVQFETTVTSVEGHLDGTPRIVCSDGSAIAAEFLAGADGQYGASRAALSAGSYSDHEMQHEFRWLTLLAQAAPSADWTIYAQQEGGFAGHLLRTDEVTRFHLQVPFGDTVEDWPDERIWHELRTRLGRPGWTLNEGPVISKNMLEMRSRVTEPMRFGRLFLLGDAAHIITPSGGKGMNLAIADAAELDVVLAHHATDPDEGVLDGFTRNRVPDIWKAQEFSHALIHMMHTYPGGTPEAGFRQKLQHSRLWQLQHSRAYARNFAESYIGPSLRWPEPAHPLTDGDRAAPVPAPEPVG